MKVTGGFTAVPRYAVHQYGPGDAAQVCRILGAAYARVAGADPAYHLEVEVPAQIRTEIAAGEQMVALREGGTDVGLVKIREDTAAGLLHFRRLSSPHGGHAEPCGVLLEWLVAEASRRGLQGIRCHTVPQHTDLGYLHRTAGLRVMGDEAVSFPNGAQELVLRLEGRRSTDSMSLVELDPEDAAQLTEVLHRAFSEVHHHGAPSPVMQETPVSWRHRLLGRDRALAVRADGHLIAAVVLHPTASGEAREFSHLAVTPEHRGRGAAVLLLEALRDRARATGAHLLSCTVPAHRTEVLSLLTRQGFGVDDRGLCPDADGELVPAVRLVSPL